MKKITFKFLTMLAIVLTGLSTMAQTQVFWVDLNWNSSTTPTAGNWNNMTNEATPLTNIINGDGTVSSYSITVTDLFTTANTTGSTAPGGTNPFPSTATSDAFVGTTSDTGAFTFSGLDVNKVYLFEIFAARIGVTDNREALYTATGANVGTATLNASGNNDNTCSIANIQPDASGNIVLSCVKGPNNVNGTGYFYINCFRMTETTPVPAQVLLDAEDGTTNKLTLNVMANGPGESNADYTVVDNPNPSGINTSSKVVQFRRNTAGDPWSGFWSPVVDPDPDFTSNKYVHVKVLKTRISPVKFKIQGGAAGDLEIASVNAQTQIGVWEDYVFDFSSKTGTYPTVVFMPDFLDPGENIGDIMIYFDDIVVNSIATPTMGINDNYLVGKISVFPNPSNGLLTVESLEEIQSVSIFSLDGRQVANYDNMSVGITQINIENLSKGMYFMNFVAPNGATFTHKLIKE